MKKRFSLTCILILIISNTIQAQNNRRQYLRANEANALINSSGILFENTQVGVAGYEIPKNSGRHSFFCASIWIGGKDENDSLRLAALRYRQGRDFFSGPYTTLPNIPQNLDYSYQWEKEIWKVSKEQIACHIVNFNNPNYIIPQDILTWPAHGDTNLGISANLAPFVDLNADGTYSPELGEYPLILGDESVYYIMNDVARNHGETYGLPLGIEVHVMAYQFKETNSFADSTTFLKYKIINKGSHTYDSLFVSFWADADVGNYADDYFGSDPTRNMIYFYNGDLDDENDGGRLGYGLNPPAVGVLSLNDTMNYSSYFTSTSAYPFNDPGPAAEYFNFMQGKWANGSQMYYGGLGYHYNGSTGTTDTITNHCFPGASDINGLVSTNGVNMSNSYPNGWDEASVSNPPGDRRGVSSNNSTNLLPGEFRIVDYAIIYGRSSNGTLTASVERLAEVADSCQQFYNSNSLIQSNLTTINNDINSYPPCNTLFLPPNLNVVSGPIIRRLDGYGNGGISLELTNNCRDSIFSNGFYPITEYQEGKGPINIEIIDSSNYPSGYFRLDFQNYTAPLSGNSADTAKWILYHSLNNIVTTYEGLYNISFDSIQIIPQLGLRLNIHQNKYFFPDGTGSLAVKSTDMIDAKMEFSGTTPWLTGINDNEGFLPTNWIRSGDYAPETDPSNPSYECQPSLPTYYNPCNYRDESNADPQENFENILDGIIAPHRLVGYQGDYMPLAYYGTFAQSSKTNASISFLPSVDIVITSDQSKWTRCPVIELGRNISNNIGNAVPGGFRQSPSVNKNGQPDGTGTGMGWFPGYAVDLESGARLYMAFGENSSLSSSNGIDMIWNPTSVLFDTLGIPIFGGQHAIYIFSYKQKSINGFPGGFDFPAYVPTEAEVNGSHFLQNKWLQVETNSSTAKRELYGSLSWIMNPRLIEGQSLLQSDAKIKLRINKEYKNFIATGNNNGKPSYEWGNNVPLQFLQTFKDYNNNCLKDSLETALNSINGIVFPSQINILSDQNGSIPLSLSDGSYFILFDTTNINWALSCSDTFFFQVQNGNIIGANEIGFENITTCTEPEVSIFAPTLRPCFPNQMIYVSACNDYTAEDPLIGSYVDVELDPLINISSSSLPYSNLGNNVYRFQTGDLYPGQCVNFNISSFIYSSGIGCASLLGLTLCMDANLHPVEPCVLDNTPSDPIVNDGTGGTLNGFPQACTLPWDQSSLSVDGWCANDSIYFTITNTGVPGGGDMECYSPMWITVDGVVTYTDSIMIPGGQTITLAYPGDGATWILNAEQHPLHPGNSHPNAHVEACGDSTNWTPDNVNDFPQDDADPVVDIYCGVVTGSFDPNDKTGYPIGQTVNNYIQPNQQLQYVIRFQNTGTDTAFTVVIRDTLDTDFNIFTVTSGVSSHNYEFRMYGPRVLEWTFNNINLPDSATNQAGSNGFVTFHVDQVPNLTPGTEITNDADIYFDFNDPITTNTTMHRIYEGFVSVLNVEELTQNGKSLLVYPNPTSNIINIKGKENMSQSFSIYDQMGRKVIKGKLNGISTEVNLSSLSKGIYSLKIEGNYQPAQIVKE